MHFSRFFQAGPSVCSWDGVEGSGATVVALKARHFPPHGVFVMPINSAFLRFTDGMG
jgi:hypothetical protein